MIVFVLGSPPCNWIGKVNKNHNIFGIFDRSMLDRRYSNACTYSVHALEYVCTYVTVSLTVAGVVCVVLVV